MVGAIERLHRQHRGARKDDWEQAALRDLWKRLGRCRFGDGTERRRGPVRAVRQARVPPPALASEIVRHEGAPAFRIARQTGKGMSDVVLTQRDVRQLQLAKGAVRAGIDALLQHAELAPRDVDRVFLAGSFGAHLQPASLVGIGMLPGELLGTVTAVGNTSRTGAEVLLLDREARGELVETVRKATAIDLAHAPAFEKLFVRALAFPRFEREAA